MTQPSNLAGTWEVRPLASYSLILAPSCGLGHKLMARRPRNRSCGNTESRAGSFNAKLAPLVEGASVSVPPFRSASSRAMARP